MRWLARAAWGDRDLRHQGNIEDPATTRFSLLEIDRYVSMLTDDAATTLRLMAELRSAFRARAAAAAEMDAAEAEAKAAGKRVWASARFRSATERYNVAVRTTNEALAALRDHAIAGSQADPS